MSKVYALSANAPHPLRRVALLAKPKAAGYYPCERHGGNVKHVWPEGAERGVDIAPSVGAGIGQHQHQEPLELSDREQVHVVPDFRPVDPEPGKNRGVGHTCDDAEQCSPGAERERARPRDVIGAIEGAPCEGITCELDYCEGSDAKRQRTSSHQGTPVAGGGLADKVRGPRQAGTVCRL